MTMLKSASLKKLEHFTSAGWRDAKRNHGQIRVSSFSLLKHGDEAGFLSAKGSSVAAVTFLAGSGSRWIRSLERAGIKDIDPEAPRCLHPVEDIQNPGRDIPIGTYNLRAVSGFGTNVIVYRTHRDEISEMAGLAGIRDAVFVRQDVPEWAHKPLGHGDAMRQALPYLPASVKFVVTNFGGDPNSRRTIMTSLLLLCAMRKAGLPLAGIIPTSYMEKPVYPVPVDRNGFPSRFMHRELMGDRVAEDGPMQSNLGVRVYARDDLGAVTEEIFKHYFREGTGYVINESSREFGLDNVDQAMSGLIGSFNHIDPLYSLGGRMRTLCIGEPYEVLSRVKEIENIEGFIAAQKMISEIN